MFHIAPCTHCRPVFHISAYLMIVAVLTLCEAVCARCVALLGILNALLMLVVPCIKLAEQAQISAAAKNAECKGPVRPCTGSGSGDVCSKTRELVACFQTCWCQTKIGKDAMKNFRELLDQSGAQCPLTCGPGAWLPGTSAAILILFGLFNMVFELPTALFVCSNAGCMSCCKDWIQGMRTVLRYGNLYQL